MVKAQHGAGATDDVDRRRPFLAALAKVRDTSMREDPRGEGTCCARTGPPPAKAAKAQSRSERRSKRGLPIPSCELGVAQVVYGDRQWIASRVVAAKSRVLHASLLDGVVSLSSASPRLQASSAMKPGRFISASATSPFENAINHDISLKAPSERARRHAAIETGRSTDRAENAAILIQ